MEEKKVNREIDSYSIVSSNPEIQAMHIIRLCLIRNGLDYDAWERIFNYFQAYVADQRKKS